MTGGILAWASVGKIQNPELFGSQIVAYQLVGPVTAAWIAVALPWTEFLAGLCLICGVTKAGAGLLAVVLYLVFLIARSSVLFRGLTVSCGCGLLSGDDKITGTSVVISTALLVFSASSYLLNLRPQPRPVSSAAKDAESAPRSIPVLASSDIAPEVQP
jgi:hypothetical protein